MLTSAMGDPLNEQVCAPRLSAASYRIDQELETLETLAEKSNFARSYPEFLRIGIRFLTTPGRDNVAFGKSMASCAHGCAGRQPQAGEGAGTSLINSQNRPSASIQRYRCTAVHPEQLILPKFQLYDALNTISTLIELSLADLTRHKFRAYNPDKAVQNWPQGPDDLLPFGSKQSIEALTNWMKCPPLGPEIFKLTGALSVFYAPFAQALIGQIPPEHLFLAIPVAHLEHIIADYEKLSARPAASMELAYPHFKTVINALSQFYECVQRGDGGMFPSIVRGVGTPTHGTFVKIAQILDLPPFSSPELDRARVIMGRMVDYSTHYPGLGTEMDPATMEENLAYMQNTINREMIEGTFEALKTKRRAGCANMVCPLGSESAIHAKLCGKCDLVRFCSKDCLRQAWNSKHHAHKILCSEISELRTSLGPEAWTSMWVHGFSEADFRNLCTRKSVDIIKVINNIVSPLRRFALHAEFERKILAFVVNTAHGPETMQIVRDKIGNALEDGEESQETAEYLHTLIAESMHKT